MGLAQLAGGCRRLSGIEIKDDRAPAVLGEQRGDCPADAATRRRPGNNADLVGKKHFPTFCSLL